MDVLHQMGSFFRLALRIRAWCIITWVLEEMTQFSDTDLSEPWCHQRWALVKHGAQLIAGSEKICDTCGEQLSAPRRLKL